MSSPDHLPPRVAVSHQPAMLLLQSDHHRIAHGELQSRIAGDHCHPSLLPPYHSAGLNGYTAHEAVTHLSRSHYVPTPPSVETQLPTQHSGLYEARLQMQWPSTLAAHDYRAVPRLSTPLYQYPYTQSSQPSPFRPSMASAAMATLVSSSAFPFSPVPRFNEQAPSCWNSAWLASPADLNLPGSPDQGHQPEEAFARRVSESWCVPSEEETRHAAVPQYHMSEFVATEVLAEVRSIPVLNPPHLPDEPSSGSSSLQLQIDVPGAGFDQVLSPLTLPPSEMRVNGFNTAHETPSSPDFAQVQLQPNLDESPTVISPSIMPAYSNSRSPHLMYVASSVASLSEEYELSTSSSPGPLPSDLKDNTCSEPEPEDDEDDLDFIPQVPVRQRKRQRTISARRSKTPHKRPYVRHETKTTSLSRSKFSAIYPEAEAEYPLFYDALQVNMTLGDSAVPKIGSIPGSYSVLDKCDRLKEMFHSARQVLAQLDAFTHRCEAKHPSPARLEQLSPSLRTAIRDIRRKIVERCENYKYTRRDILNKRVPHKKATDTRHVGEGNWSPIEEGIDATGRSTPAKPSHGTVHVRQQQRSQGSRFRVATSGAITDCRRSYERKPEQELQRSTETP